MHNRYSFNIIFIKEIKQEKKATEVMPRTDKKEVSAKNEEQGIAKKERAFLIINCDIRKNTVCPRSIDLFYISSYYIKWSLLRGQTVVTQFI